ncbi:lysostaphin resistance A-like protein [Streptomyces sp. NPDC050560]|uniref:lysostaphin resistance A-like protein n=1 Tax=Streptomyces sp. NPDC050560 TaxID=3365630 RepID=UPI0037994DB4
MSTRDEEPVAGAVDGTAAGARGVREGGRPGWARSFWVRLPALLVPLLGVEAATTGVNSLADATPFTALLSGVGTAALALWAYVWLVRTVEGRGGPEELALRDARSGVCRGALLGLGLFGATLGLIAACGGYRVAGWGSFGGAVTTLGLMCCVAVTEELVFRGALFRVLEERTGTWGALAVSGVLFGALHLVNEGATVWGALAIAIEAGLLFGAVYAATRSLWLPIGLHLGWNMAEGGIFGSTVSGAGDGGTGLLDGAAHGAQAVSGGAFGPEASVFAIVVCLVPTVYFLARARRLGRIRPRGGRDTATRG